MRGIHLSVSRYCGQPMWEKDLPAFASVNQLPQSCRGTFAARQNTSSRAKTMLKT